MMLFMAPLFIAGLFAGKAMREQASWKLYQRVCDARMRYISTERHYRYIKIRDWDDVAKYFVWEGED